MGREEGKGYKRLPPPIEVEKTHVAPPGCVSVGGAIPAHHQCHSPRPTAFGLPVLTRACWGGVGASGPTLCHRFDSYAQARTKLRTSNMVFEKGRLTRLGQGVGQYIHTRLGLGVRLRLDGVP
jgi:hypothetical protein